MLMPFYAYELRVRWLISIAAGECHGKLSGRKFNQMKCGAIFVFFIFPLNGKYALTAWNGMF